MAKCTAAAAWLLSLPLALLLRLAEHLLQGR
jgi:hypothetical protein